MQALAVAPDGATAYSGGQDKTIRVWNLVEGKLLRTLDPAGTGDRAGSCSGGTTHRQRRRATAWSGGWTPPTAASGRRLKGHTAAVHDLAVLAGVGRGCGSSRSPKTAPGGSGRFPRPRLQGASPRPRSQADRSDRPQGTGPSESLSRPTAEAIVTGGDDGTVRIWNARDGSPQGVLGLRSYRADPGRGRQPRRQDDPHGLGRQDRPADRAIRRQADPNADRPSRTGPERGVFSPGRPPGDRRRPGGLKVWESANGRGVIAFGHTAPNGGAIQPIQKVAFTRQGGLVSASADATLKTWHFAGAMGRAQDARHPRLPGAGSRLQPGRQAAGDRRRRAVAIGRGQALGGRQGAAWLARCQSLHSDTVFAVRFSPDGTKLASASADKFLKVTSVADGKLLRSFEGHTHHVMAVDWKSDGKQLVTGGADNVLKVWDFDSGEQIRTLQAAGKQVTSVRWIAGKPEVVGASGDTQVRIWNPDNGGIARPSAAPATTSTAWPPRPTARGSRPAAPTACSSSGTARTAR